VKPTKPDFGQDARFGAPPYRRGGFGFRRDTASFKGGLNASSCLFFWNPLGRKIEFMGMEVL
jgi:hypothetical protein